MKITVDETPKGEPIIEYPCLGISRYTAIIVLFHERQRGVVLRGGADDWKVGDYSIVWGMEGFVLFTGSITLQGE